MSINKTTSLKSYTLTVANGSTYGGANKTTFAKPAVSMSINPASGAGALSVKVDNDAASVFTIPAGQAFESRDGDCQFYSVDFANASGSAIVVQVLVGIMN